MKISNRVWGGVITLCLMALLPMVSYAGCTQDGVQCDPVATTADGSSQSKTFDLDFSTQNQPLLFPGLAPSIEAFDIDLLRRNDASYDTGSVGFDERHRFCLDSYINDYFGSTLAKAFRAATSNVCYTYGGKVGGYIRGGMWAKLGVTVKTGDVDVQYPVSITIDAPDIDAYNPGDSILLSTGFQRRDGAVVDTFFPNWGVKIALGGDAKGKADAIGCIDDCSSYNIYNFDVGGGGEAWSPAFLQLDDNFAPNARSGLGFLLGSSGHIRLPVLQFSSRSFVGNRIKVLSKDQFVNIRMDIERWLFRFLGVDTKTTKALSLFKRGGKLFLAATGSLITVQSTLNQTSEFEPRFRLALDFGRELSWEELNAAGQVIVSGFSQQMEMQIGNRLRLLTSSQDNQPITVSATAYQVNTFQASATVSNDSWMDYDLFRVNISTPSWTIFSRRCIYVLLVGDVCLPRLGWNAISYNRGPVASGTNLGRLAYTYPLFTTPVRELGGFQQFPLQSTVLNPNLPPQTAAILGDQYLHWGQNIDIDLNSLFTDPDGNMLSLSVSGLPPFLSLTATGHIQGQVDQTFEGTVQITADDGHGRTVAQSAQFIVAMPVVDLGDGLSVSEAGVSDSFHISLSAQPQANVQVDVLPQNNEVDLGNGIGVPVSLTFTAANWNQPQQVTVSAFDDFVQEGPAELSTQFLLASTSTQAGFDAMTAPVFQTQVLDDDVAGIVASPATGVVFSENPLGGTTGVFAIRLTSEPTANVSVDLTCSFSPCVADFAPNQLVFTPANWNIPQTVTAQGVDNSVADGSHPFSLDYLLSANGELFYNWRGFSLVRALVSDDDAAGVAISPAADIETGEDGTAATISVVLTSQPVCSGGGSAIPRQEDAPLTGQCPVTVTLASSNIAEGAFSGVASVAVAFDELNWNIPQVFSLSGVDDNLDDGDQSYTIITSIAATNETTGYGTTITSASIPDLPASNLDNDQSNLEIIALTPEQTAETGNTAQYSVVLTAEPTATIAVAATSQSSDEGVPTQNTLTFTAANWNVAQNLTIQGVDDAIVDGPQTYAVQLSASGDPQYNQMQALSITLSNQDNDMPGVQMQALGSSSIPELGGSVDYQVFLDRQPQTNVSLNFESSDSSEALVSPSSLLFTPANWATPQVLSVTAVDDPDNDGNQPVTIRVLPIDPSIPGFGGFDPADALVTVLDDDTPEILVTPTNGLQLSEPDGMAGFELRLASRPTDEVRIALSSSDPSVADIVGSAVVVFDPASWNLPRSVSVRAVDDAVADGNKNFSIITANATSIGDADYNNMNVADVTLTRLDDDTPGVLVSPLNGLATGEDGSSATINISLASMPTAAVTIGLSLSDTSEANLSASSVQILPADWNLPHPVTVTGRDELLVDGDQTYRLITAVVNSGDAGYAGIDPDDVTLTNIDDDVAGLVVSATNLATSEAGTSDNFTVKLAARPLGQVKVALVIGDPSEGTLSVPQLLFDGTDWNTAKPVIVTGVNDILDDGDQTYVLAINIASDSMDEAFKKVHSYSIDVLNRDDGDPKVRIDPIGNLVTNESGSQARFSVSLDRAPAAGKQVVISFSSTDVGEGSVLPVSMTLTEADWDQPHQVILTGVNDDIDDGDQLWKVIIAPVVSSDPHFAGFDPQDVAVVNVDNDIDTDGDGVIDMLEGDEDRDSDGLANKLDYDPTGYFYDSATGDIVPGGSVSVSCNRGSVSFINGRNGSSGYYQYIVTGLGANDTATCVQSFTPPAGYMPDVNCQDKGSLMVQEGPLPLVLGADENQSSGVLTDASCAANPYYKTLIIERTDAPIFSNNIALAVANSPGMPVPLRNNWSWLLLVLLLSLTAIPCIRRYGLK